MFLIDNAFAAEGGLMQTNGLTSGLTWIILLVGMMYLMIIRPQNKKAKEHKQLMAGVQVDDEVVTIGGLYGIVIKTEEQMLTLRISDNAILMIQKQAVAQMLPKGTLKF